MWDRRKKSYNSRSLQVNLQSFLTLDVCLLERLWREQLACALVLENVVDISVIYAGWAESPLFPLEKQTLFDITLYFSAWLFSKSIFAIGICQDRMYNFLLEIIKPPKSVSLHNHWKFYSELDWSNKDQRFCLPGFFEDWQ